MFANFNDGLGSDPFDFVDEKPVGHSLRAHTTNNIWPLVIAAGITAVGGIVSSLAASPGGAGGSAGKIRESTVSGNSTGAQDFLYDLTAVKNMQDFTAQMGEWSGQDRNFFDSVYKPFQEDLMEANQAMLPNIVANSSEAMQQNLSDLFDSSMLKDSFKEATLKTGAQAMDMADKFAEQIDSIPSSEQRIGQAISGVEQRFGQAGAELKKTMGAKGLDVSEASVRDMMIGKATAKAGAAQQAGEGARRELMDATAAATGVFSKLQTQSAEMLGGERDFTQASTDMQPQVGGVKDLESVSGATSFGAQMTTADAGKQLGTTSEKKDVTMTQRGIRVSKFFDPETGDIVTGAGDSITDWNMEKDIQRKALENEMAQKTNVAIVEEKANVRTQEFNEILGH